MVYRVALKLRNPKLIKTTEVAKKIQQSLLIPDAQNENFDRFETLPRMLNDLHLSLFVGKTNTHMAKKFLVIYCWEINQISNMIKTKRLTFTV